MLEQTFSFLKAIVRTVPSSSSPRPAWTRLTGAAHIVLSFGTTIWGNKESSLSWKCLLPCCCLAAFFSASTALAAFPSLLLGQSSCECRALWTIAASRKCSWGCKEGSWASTACCLWALWRRLRFYHIMVFVKWVRRILSHRATPSSQRKWKGLSFALSCFSTRELQVMQTFWNLLNLL